MVALVKPSEPLLWSKKQSRAGSAYADCARRGPQPGARPGWNCRACRAEQGLGCSGIAARLYDTPRMPSRRVRSVLIVLLTLCAQFPGLSFAAGTQKFRADEWITECDQAPGIGSADCSITVPFWQTQGKSRASFALVIMLQTANIGIVGQPFPVRAVLRVDKNPPIECRQERYCVFSTMQALAVLKQLKVGSLILIDVYSTNGVFNFSLTPKGYQAGIAQIRAWGYRTE
jgi:hypothetical protein